MKIIVRSRKEMNHLWVSNKDLFNDENRYFISISGIADGMNYPYPLINSRMLRLKFDDITRNEQNLILFGEEDAKKIHEFVDQIKNLDCYLYVNCAAGISRSGAVGYCINSYVNSNNSEDFKFFEENNKQIQPNPVIKSILHYELFSKTNYKEIFKNNLT